MIEGRLPAVSLGASNVLHAAAPATVAWHRAAGDVWAMALASDALLLAGPLLPAEPTRELPEPLFGPGWLDVADPRTGRTRQRIELPCAPMQDGFAIEGGRVFLSLADGRMIAFETSPP
jgi:hypothetical protein